MPIVISLGLILIGIWSYSEDNLHVTPPPITIEEGTYQGADHFIITTASSRYYYDRTGGGFSRMLDHDGKDWIGFRREPWGEYPASAASAYRGLPNFVFGSEDGGAGHPGHDRCRSEIIDHHSILTTSLSGKWQWRWDFFEDHARVKVLRTDPDQPYWFLYEGTPGGRFAPEDQFYGTDQGGPHFEELDYYRDEKLFDHWRWAYFGDRTSDRVLLVVQAKADSLSDTFSFLGNTKAGINSPDGMVVFGFGRADGAKPLLRGPQVFYVGFVEKAGPDQKLHRSVRKKVRKWKR